MTTLSERGLVLLTVPVDKAVRDWLRRESKQRRLPQGVIVARALRVVMGVSCSRLDSERLEWKVGS